MTSHSKYHLLLSAIFFFIFLLLTPLGIFNDWIPPLTQTGHYSIATIDPGDDTGYYAYLRSAFFDGDWDFINEGNYAHAENFTPTGYVFNNWQIGQSILFLPFFLVGHLVALIYNSLGYAVSVDGYSAPYYMATAVASQTYLFAGLLLLFNILKKRFGGSIALISTLVIWLGSPLLYYTFIRQRMANTAEFFVAVVFVYFWLKHRNSQSFSKHALLGAILGFLCMIRVINSVLLLLYLVDQLVLLKQSEPALKVIGCKRLMARVFCFSGFWFLAFMPQFFTWYKIGGLPMPAFHVEDTKNIAALFSIEKVMIPIRDMLFGSHWGLIFSSPITIVGFCGLLVSKKNHKIPRLGLVLSVLAAAFIVVFFDKYLAAYEYRYLTPIFPAVAIGVAIILSKLSKSTFGVVSAVAFVSICIFAQYFMLIQYKVTLFYDDPEFTVKALGAIPSILFEHVELLLRSSNFIRLISLDHPQAWNYRDFLFLTAFPVSQLVCVILVFAGFERVARLPKTALEFRSKLVAGGVALTALSLVILIGFLTPSKTRQEINNRKIFAELMKKGNATDTAEKLDEVINLYDKAYLLVPDSYSLLYGLGVVYGIKGELEKSNEYYRKALAIYPNHVHTLLNLGVDFLSLKEFGKAESYLKSAARAGPGIAEIYDAQAKVYMRSNQQEKALEMFRTAFTVDPGYHQARINMAIFLFTINRHEEALQQTQKLIARGIRKPNVLKLAKLYGLPAP